MLSADELGIILLSLKVAGASVLFSLPLALGCALLLARGSFPGKTLFDAVVHLPLVLPPVVIGYALLVLFGRQGAIGALLHDWLGITLAFRWTGAALAAAVMGFPLMVRAMRLSIEAVAPRLEWAARTLGASRWRAFYSVTLPLAMPGIAVGVLLAFARSLGEFGATITFVSNIPGETRTIALAMYTLIERPDGGGGMLRLAAVSLALAFGALLLSEWMVRRSAYRRPSE